MLYLSSKIPRIVFSKRVELLMSKEAERPANTSAWPLAPVSSHWFPQHCHQDTLDAACLSKSIVSSPVYWQRSGIWIWSQLSSWFFWPWWGDWKQSSWCQSYWDQVLVSAACFKWLVGCLIEMKQQWTNRSNFLVELQTVFVQSRGISGASRSHLTEWKAKIPSQMWHEGLRVKVCRSLMTWKESGALC